MGEELRKQLPVAVEYIAGAGGIFEVSVDGTLLYSKKQAGRFPETAEVVSLLKGS